MEDFIYAGFNFMIQINKQLQATELVSAADAVANAAKPKIRSLEKRWNPKDGTPVFTEAGRYTTRGWTEWTQGFQYGNALLTFELAQDEEYLTLGRRHTLGDMATHLTHIGVHDHGFNNVSTYGNLLRFMSEGLIPEVEWERNFYELALKVTGAVQAARWTALAPDMGFIYSFNGPHSLFADTVRSLRALAVAHQLGHVLMGEMDRRHSLLERLLQHAEATARYTVYYGSGRDAYDLRGRTAHESVFNLNDKAYRCPNSQQGYSPFSTWTRGLAWVMCGFAEEIEYLDQLAPAELEPHGGRAKWLSRFIEVAQAVCDFYIEHTPTDGIPYWDTGAPGLHRLGDYLDRPAEPFNDHEPVDSSAAAIGAQGLIRLGRYLQNLPDTAEIGSRYLQAGLTTAQTLFREPYLSVDPNHEGLLLHTVYHRPNGWDYIPAESKIPYGESAMWGDYHLLELAVLVKRLGTDKPYHRFFNLKKNS